MEDVGGGEILLNYIDKDVSEKGHDIDFIKLVNSKINIPLIACGGAGNKIDILECFKKTKIDAVAAGNIFHFRENSYVEIKEFLRKKLSYIR